MVLADTSVWVTHLRRGSPRLSGLLSDGAVAVHPFVIGELACGNIGNRAEILSLLGSLPAASVAEHGEIMGFIENRRLMGKGLAYIDAHLLASSMLSGARLWTEDKPLARAASAMGIAFHP